MYAQGRNAMGVNPTTVSNSEIHIIILRPDADEPGILSILADGTGRLKVFANDEECDQFWMEIENSIQNDDFVHYYGVYFRAKELKMIEKCHSKAQGHYLRLQFNNEFEFHQRYTDAEKLNTDLSKITDILGTLQDIRASRMPSPTKQ